ncbi:MAG: F0F1 ATP synthase subunit delta [Geminicoccaceae bacterium]
MSGTIIIAILIGVAVPFFFPIVMELLGLPTGIIQAYIFAILAMVYIALRQLRSRPPGRRLPTGAGRTNRAERSPFMDSIALIAAVSIFTAGITIAIGRPSAQPSARAGPPPRRSAIAQQPDEANRITRTLFVSLAMIESTVIYCFVVAMILIFANPFWNYMISQGAGYGADRLAHGRSADRQFPRPGLAARAFYGPITAAMARREAHRRAAEPCGGKAQAAADREARSFATSGPHLEQARERLLREAHEAADKERKALEQEARSAVEARKQEWLQQLATERETVPATCAAARPRPSTPWRGGRSTIWPTRVSRTRWRSVSPASSPGWTTPPPRRSPQPQMGRVRVRSRFELGAEARRQIDRAVHERLDPGIEVAYTVDAGLACGVVLEAGSQRLSWSLASYLDGFEAAVEKELAGA